MNKKVNTAIFLLVATAVNIGIMLIIFIVLMVLVTMISGQNAQLAQALYIISFFAAIVATFFIYNVLIKFFQKKVDMDKYFHPIFKRKSR